MARAYSVQVNEKFSQLSVCRCTCLPHAVLCEEVMQHAHYGVCALSCITCLVNEVVDFPRDWRSHGEVQGVYTEKGRYAQEACKERF